MLKILTVVGARPQFIKAAAVSKAIALFNVSNSSQPIEEIIVHTGQHYDANMSDIFFDELSIPKPAVNLNIGSLSHGAMTGRLIEALEQVLLKECPNLLLVYGDTNSTLAAALAAVKLHIPIIHIEAGLRSFNMAMPEEINRILTDAIASELFCPSDIAYQNVHFDKTFQAKHIVGDVMYDVARIFSPLAREKVSLEEWGVEDGKYALCTVHRAENVGDKKKLDGICKALAKIAQQMPILFPVHPRTANVIMPILDIYGSQNIHVLEPLPFLSMTRLLMSASGVLTDSGGVQKEAFFQRVPCITLRNETEWLETVSCGANYLAGTAEESILKGWNSRVPVPENYFPYGDGFASDKIIKILASKYSV